MLWVVSPLSPVSIQTFIFASWNSRMQLETLSCSKSSRAVQPRRFRSYSNSSGFVFFIDWWSNESVGPIIWWVIVLFPNISVLRPSFDSFSIFSTHVLSTPSSHYFITLGIIAMSAPFTNEIILLDSKFLTMTDMRFLSLVNSIWRKTLYFSSLPFTCIIISSLLRYINLQRLTFAASSKNVSSS